MKKVWLVLVVCVLLVAGPVFAADTMALSSVSSSPTETGKGWGNSLEIVLLCTAAANGTFTSRTIDETVIPARNQFNYWEAGYYLLDAWAVNDVTTYAGSGAVTVTSGDRQIIGTASGDTLTLSTAAYNSATGAGVGYLSAARGASQRKLSGTGAPVVSVSDTGDASNIFKLHLVFGK